MIRRGAGLSRLLALLVALGPVLLGLGAFGAWALKLWTTDTTRLQEATQALHLAKASAEQAMLYKPLGEAWSEYAATEISGLAQQPTGAAAIAETQTRLRELYTRFDGVALTAEPLPSVVEDGLERFRLETRGELPEKSLAGFLIALESEPPFLFVDHLDIERSDSAASGARTKLALRLRVSAFRLGEAAE